VGQGVAEKKPLSAWTLADFKAFSALFDQDLRLSLDSALSRRAVIGGTALRSVRAALRQIQKKTGHPRSEKRPPPHPSEMEPGVLREPNLS